MFFATNLSEYQLAKKFHRNSNESAIMELWILGYQRITDKQTKSCIWQMDKENVECNLKSERHPHKNEQDPETIWQHRIIR